MKVALVHMRFSWTGGTERYLRQIAEHLADSGNEVTVLCRSVKGERLPGVRFVLLRNFAIGGTWRQWAFAKAVERHVRARKYDVVYGLGKTWTHDVIRLGGGLHQTYLETAHDATLSPLDRLIGRGAFKHRQALKIEQRALASGAYLRVVANSELVKRDVVQRYGVPNDRVTVVYNGVDVKRFDRAANAGKAAALRREFGIADDHIVILFLGTGYGRKGLAPVIEAFATVTKSHPEARVMVVGFDSQASRFEQQAQERGVADKVRFLGGRPDTEVCYAASDIYVLPTLYDPFANTTLEALASGLPVITTAANGACELIEPGVHGTVLDDSAPDRIAEALIQWLPAERRAAARDATRALALEYPSERTARESTYVLAAVAEEKAASDSQVSTP